MNNMSDRPQPIGALWARSSKGSGKAYYTGEVTIAGETHRIVVFTNDYKTKENQPDLKIFPQQERVIQRDEPAQNQEALNNVSTRETIDYPTAESEGIDPESIPF